MKKKKIDSIIIWIHIEIKNEEKINQIVTGLKSSVNQEYYKQGYDVSDVFKYGSDNGFDGRFYTAKNFGDSLIDTIKPK